ncbi:MAG: hydrogen gas-evolving membrane-bound hydrogenase subunit E [Thermoplasmata archaeon]
MRKVFALLAILVVFSFMILAVVELRGEDGGFGEPMETKMDEYFLEDSQSHNQVNNVATAILFDYRGLDTLGEATVLFAAVSGVLTVLRKFKPVKRGGKK